MKVVLKDNDNVDDVNDYGHQINIEEYLYNKKTSKKVVIDVIAFFCLLSTICKIL